MATTLRKIYKSVILEIRPRLQSVNVLVNLLCEIGDINVTLNEDNFQMIIDSEIYAISCKNLKIVPNSLTSLAVTESSVSFRFATATSSDDWGSFRTELLKTSYCSPKATSQSTFLRKSVSYCVKCGNCSQDITEPVQFERVLPLPSENSEPNDWFCHAHSSNVVLSPKESDIFYTICYCHLNQKIVRNVMKSEKLLVCKRCFNWLGQTKGSDIVKLWFNTVIFKEGRNIHTSSALHDIFETLNEVLSSVLFNTAKIMLCCQSSKSNTDYILIWVLEKQLRVQICIDDEMQDRNVAKVLFKYESSCSEIVKKWMQDASVVSVDVSKPMILEILKHLHKFNKIFPKMFSESNNFYISYLMMYDHNK